MTLLPSVQALKIAKGVLAYAKVERAKNPDFKLTEEAMAVALGPLLQCEFPSAKFPMKKPERDVLFDAFSLSCGINPTEATPAIKRSIAVALADILSVSPDVTPNDFRDRAEAYKKKHKDWPLTCSSLAKYWGEFGKASGRTVAAKGDVYQEPENWKSDKRIQESMKLSDGTWEVVSSRDWFDLAVDLRADILRILA